VTSLIERFQYPKLGPRMMWERCHELVEGQGSKVALRNEVARIERRDGRAVAVTSRGPDGGETTYRADHVISSMPLPALVTIMDPPPPPEVQAAADGLGFRDFLSIALVVPADKVAWTDNWIYIHAPEVKTMRVQNFRSWSPHMVREGYNVLGLEYTVMEGDEWWTAADHELVERGKAELEALGLMRAEDVVEGYVVRMPKAYPMYDDTYKANVEVLRRWLEANAANVHPVGRNGMHRYNNQDHSMLTAVLTVDNIFGAAHDIWAVNVEEEYHEESVPTRDAPSGA
jgi:protoporphyrinogen oxidase